MLKRFFLMAVVAMAGGSLWAEEVGDLLARENSAFAFDLYGKLSDPEGNLFFSPYSISTALAMTQAGARGETEKQMAKVLHFSQPEKELNAAFAQLQGRLKEAQGDDKVTLAIANSIWPGEQYKILDSYKDTLKSNFGVSVAPLDYGKTEEARVTINNWVEKKTHDKIKDLIGPGVLTPDVKLTLVNAIYFFGKWQAAFDPKQTTDADFQVSPGKKETVSMMARTGEYSYAEQKYFQILQVPYQEAELSMLIVLPKKGDGLHMVEAMLSGKNLAEWKTQLTEKKVVVQLPKFKMTWGAQDITGSLKKLGMTEAFNASRADFSGMDGDPHGLYVGLVLHKAFIDVSESGTEAAAATAVTMMTAMAPMGPPPPVFRADHPFFFLIQENQTGSILFMGRVVDPKAGGG